MLLREIEREKKNLMGKDHHLKPEKMLLLEIIYWLMLSYLDVEGMVYAFGFVDRFLPACSFSRRREGDR